MMTLSNVDLLRLLPIFMRRDAAIRGLADGLDEAIQDLTNKAAQLTKWNQIDSMTDEQLDEMAWELDIPWYSYTADIDAKRRVIQESDLVYARLGTKWAVEEVISAYFGSGYVQEWFDYDGDPYHFRVVSDNVHITTDLVSQFMHLLDIVKRESAWLDGILITLTGEMHLNSGFCVHDSERDSVNLTGIYSQSTPGQPLNLIATVGDGYVTLSWDEPSDTGDSPIIGYQVSQNGVDWEDV
jgi:P2-related tail formation protein